MANKEKEAPEQAKAEGEEAAEGGAKKGKKKLLFIVVGLVVVIAVAAGVLLGGGKKEEAAHGEEAAHAEMTEEEKAAKAEADAQAALPVYYELPEFLVNLNSNSSRTSFIKMSVTLELRDQEAVALVDANKPRIQDLFITYLRELRPADIQGSAGIFRLRTELLSRLNGTIQEGIVKDILFGEIVIQ
jgi:flagellar FliL protein